MNTYRRITITNSAPQRPRYRKRCSVLRWLGDFIREMIGCE